MVITWRHFRATKQISTDILRTSSLEQVLWENGEVFHAFAFLSLLY